jgi:N-acetylglucosamine-6-sulfatase
LKEVRSVFGPRDRRRSVGVRTSRFSYTVYSSGARELYDLAVDPHQLDSVIRDPSYRRDRRALHAVLAELEDCRGTDCRVPLPGRLAASAAVNRATSEQWFADHRRRYGWR